MKSRGFTLAELIAVIAVLAIILTITVPTVAGMIESSQERAYDLDLQALERAAKDYFLDENIRIDQTGATVISLVDLQTAGVIKEIVDPVSQEQCEGYVVIRRNYKMYTFDPYLKCAQSYVSDGYGDMDISSPVITLNGDNTITLYVGAQYVDPGATAVDETDGDVTSNIVVTSNVNTNKAGMYTVRYEVKDNIGNAAVAVRDIIVIDASAPQITLLGDNPVTMNSGDVYADQGAIAVDDADGDISHKIIVTGTVNPNVIGTYQITYRVVDSAGNESAAIRTINVVDTVDPIIVFGVNGVTEYAKKHITIVTVSDEHSGVNTMSLKYLWKTNTLIPEPSDFTNTFTNGSVIETPSGVSGGYYLWVIGSDNAGNTVIERSNVFNVDNGYPQITILGDNPTIIPVNSTYNDAGATAYDTVDGDLTANITVTGTVNPDARGAYTIVYRVSDSSGNETLAARTVQVKDTVPPVIFFGTNGNTTYAKTRSSTINVTDDHSGVDTDSIKYLWSTNTTEPTEADFFTGFTNGTAVSSPVGVTGGYYLWVFAKDRDGNIKIARTNVFNLDNTPPVITITGNNPVTHSAGTAYADAGATATDNIDGTITSSIVATGTVNPSVKGTYTITYNVTDSCGNMATAKVRTINVVDDTPPVIAFSMNGNTTYAKSRSTTVNVTDTYSSLSVLKYQWSTSTSTPTEGSFTTNFGNGNSITTPSGVTGGYYLWILAKDSDNNTLIQRTNVFNLDNTKPVITITGTNPVYRPKGSSYTDAGATASDNISGNITSSITVSGSVNTASVGTYTLTYNVTDSSGNAATAVSRTIYVIESTYTFTTAGQSGVYGPNQTQVNSAYSGTTLSGSVTSSGGIQLWSLPGTGTYQIEVWGAQGGGSCGGRGARMRGVFTLNAGQQLKILVGQAGMYNYGGGGGGGTFVTLSDNSPLIIAAGGGGQNYSSSCGQGGLTTTSGGRLNTDSGLPGTNGNGGDPGIANSGGCGWRGSGGGGLYTNGGLSGDGGGFAFVNGGTGSSIPSGACTSNGLGGFGGGGTGGNGGGGGGGYSGGGGGANGNYVGGGAGGSYNSGSSQSNSENAKTGHGQVVITFLP